MASAKKQVQQTARQFFKLSLDAQGAISAERVSGVLEYVEKHRPAHALAVMRAYQRLVAAELARSRALVEHAGTITPAALEQIAAAMSRRYGRTITGAARRNDTLLAGLRVRVGDDVYESSVSGQLAALGAAV
jgi:F-type H+-transporting ATPase subunit delta